MLIGYLTAVARQLDERGITARTLRAEGAGVEALRGVLTLDVAPTSRWAATRLCWMSDLGWSATLRRDIQRIGGVARYLRGPLVPSPAIVARFTAALHDDQNTVLARAAPNPPRPLDRRWLVLQLMGAAGGVSQDRCFWPDTPG
jgi:hypothetical protein